jgi:hypothetical protein
MTSTTVSIIISSYNYSRYLAEAIDSALSQTHSKSEVVVVDDGSTDESRAIIRGYGSSVVPVLKQNGGMASAWNVGFASCHGDIVIFLDADDMLHPEAAARAAAVLGPGDAKVHWPVGIIDENGQPTGKRVPAGELPEGDLRELALAGGPDAVTSPPINGNAWSRRFLEQVLPMPEGEFRQHSDTYLYTLAPLAGAIRRISDPLGSYRVHGANDFASRPLEEKNRRNLELFSRRCRVMSEYASRVGLQAKAEQWTTRNDWYAWMLALDAALSCIREVIPEGETIILVDQSEWDDGWAAESVVAGCFAVPFLERDGTFWGPPPDDATAISELERLRSAGATHLVIGWPAFWWLTHYEGLSSHLHASHSCLLQNEHVVIFRLHAPGHAVGGLP